MKKATIWFLTIIMALTFSGLLYIQIMYMKNMVRMRDDQFAEGVRRSLYSVSTALEQDETRHFLEEDALAIEQSLYNQIDKNNRNGIGSFNYSFTTPDGLEANLTIQGDFKSLPKLNGNIPSDRFRTMQETIRGQYLYQRGLLNEVIFNILSQSSNRPIRERADSAVVDGYLRTEFDNNGLNLPFEYAVVNRGGGIVYKSAGYDAANVNSNSSFFQVLFPNDPASRSNSIKVYFPTKKDYIMSSIKFMIPSFIFTFILLIVR